MVEFNAPRKSLGQNFLHDPNVIRRIIDAFNPQPDDIVVEIGPGRGALTAHLIGKVAELHLLELDRDLAEWHSQRGYGAEVSVHNVDALEFDYASLVKGGKIRVIGNLPYNISTPILFHLLDQSEAIDDMLFMLQKEVVERICAVPGNKTWGRLSVMMQWQCAVANLFKVKPACFVPPPKVDSAILSARPYQALPHPAPPQRMAEIVKAAFTHRRKTLRNSLKELLTEEQIRGAGIDPAARPERLSVADFAALASVQGRF